MTFREFITHPWVKQEIKTCTVATLAFAALIYGFAMVTPT